MKKKSTRPQDASPLRVAKRSLAEEYEAAMLRSGIDVSFSSIVTKANVADFVAQLHATLEKTECMSIFAWGEDPALARVSSRRL